MTMISRPKRLHFLLLIVLAALISAACGSDGGGVLRSDSGRLQIVLSADPVPSATSDASGRSDDEHDDDDERRLAQANVTFSSILARDLDGRLIDVETSLPATVDLLSLLDGRSFALPMGVLPPGTYDQLVVVMTRVELVTHDGTTVVITPPGGGWTAIVRVCPFRVIEGETTTVRLRFRHERAFVPLGDGFGFEPAFECR